MIEEPPLLTVKAERPRPTAAQLAALDGVPTGFLTDAMSGQGALDPTIRPLNPEVLSSVASGPVLTCACGPADLLAVLGALTEIQAGDILVADSGDWQKSAIVGDRVMGMLKNAGAAGFVTDGLVRDLEGINEVGLPVFCKGLSPNSPYAKGPGTIGTDIQLGGVSVKSGDILVTDDSGIVVVPYERIDEVIASVAHIKELEEALDAKVADGLVVPDDIRSLMESDQVKRI
ncbi:aldolase [Chromatiales bacterium (ex Bugula neritina AB1)]|nr:aldolase [Chromatiales bacterium (ex Bugula neritina AB1)]